MHFWKSFQKAMGTRLTMSTTFHPQIDGQSERTIQVLEDMLRACVLDHKGDSCHSRVIRNQQYLYPKFPPTAVVKLLQYSGSRVKHRDGFSSYK